MGYAKRKVQGATPPRAVDAGREYSDFTSGVKATPPLAPRGFDRDPLDHHRARPLV